MASNVVNRPILLKNSSGALAHICRGGQTIPGVAIVDPGSVDRPLCTERNDCSGPIPAVRSRFNAVIHECISTMNIRACWAS